MICHFVVGLGARNHASGIVFAPCGGESHDVDDGNRIGNLDFSNDEVPGFALIFGTGGDRLAAVEHAAAAHRQYHVDVILLAQTHPF